MFSKRLATERKRLGLTQQAVADGLELSRPVVSMLESGKIQLDVGRLLRLQKMGFDIMRILVDEPARVAAGQMLDWGLCIAIVREVEQWCGDHAVVLRADGRAAVVKNLYLQFSARGALDVPALRELLSGVT